MGPWGPPAATGSGLIGISGLARLPPAGGARSCPGVTIWAGRSAPSPPDSAGRGEGVVGREAQGPRRRTWAVRKSGINKVFPRGWGRVRFDPSPGMGSADSGKMSRVRRPPQPTWGGPSESLSPAQVDGAQAREAARQHPQAPCPRGHITALQRASSLPALPVRSRPLQLGTGWPSAQTPLLLLRVRFLKKGSARRSPEHSQPSLP